LLFKFYIENLLRTKEAEDGNIDEKIAAKRKTNKQANR
jgi:hypothetical protein